MSVVVLAVVVVVEKEGHSRSGPRDMTMMTTMCTMTTMAMARWGGRVCYRQHGP